MQRLHHANWDLARAELLVSVPSYLNDVMIPFFFLQQTMTKGFIDIHHHFFPSTLNKARTNEEVGWQTPEGHLPWTPELSLKFMDQAGIDTAILSFPALSAGSVSEENRTLARERNTYMAKVCQDYPGRFGFFATMPFLQDVEGRVFINSYKIIE